MPPGVGGEGGNLCPSLLRDMLLQFPLHFLSYASKNKTLVEVLVTLLNQSPQFLASVFLCLLRPHYLLFPGNETNCLKPACGMHLFLKASIGGCGTRPSKHAAFLDE